MKNINKFIIVTTKLIVSIAHNLKLFLIKNNFVVDIIFDLTKEKCERCDENTIFIIMHINRILNHYPKKYIFFQIEQSTSNYFTEKYIEHINNCSIIWEFSMKNYDKYKKNDIYHKLFYMPLPFFYKKITCDKKNIIYDIFFMDHIIIGEIIFCKN